MTYEPTADEKRVIAWLRKEELRLLKAGYDNAAFNFDRAAQVIERGEHHDG